MATVIFDDDANHQQILTKALYNTAQFYVARGWSVIPVMRELNTWNAKTPAISEWKLFQQRQPTPDELRCWFLDRKHAGLAVVCGAVSRLLVFDFDDARLAQAFAREFPHLARTYAVRSGMRGLPHYYFTVGDGVPLSGWCVSGLDVRGDGQYVVAPPTPSAHGGWQVLNDADVLHLDFGDFSRLLNFFRSDTRAAVKTQQKTPFRPIATESQTDFLFDEKRVLNAAALTAYYRSLALRSGRNNALFAAACFARDCGWSQAQALAHLLPLHVHQAALVNHPAELPQQREAEARRTIASAYTQPPRSRPAAKPKALPNALREKLLQSGLNAVAAARLLDALLHLGWSAGRVFTEREAFEAVQPVGIGRRSVRNALAAVVAKMRLFETLTAAPSPAPQPTAGAATGVAIQTNKCFVGRVSNRVKNAESGSRGRPATRFVLPSVARLCERLRLQAESSDMLTSEDFASPSRYRRAQHSALIARRPGQYGRTWLAQRLGVSRQTTRRYERQIGILAHPVYAQTPITPLMVETLPKTKDCDHYMEGMFIEDAQGRRYPALQPVARRLLRQTNMVFQKRQLPNYYVLPSSVESSGGAAAVGAEIYKGSIGPISPSPARTSAYKGSIGPISAAPTRTLDKRAPAFEQPQIPHPAASKTTKTSRSESYKGSIGPLYVASPADIASALPPALAPQTAAQTAPPPAIIITPDGAPPKRAKAARQKLPRNFRAPLMDVAKEAFAATLCETTRQINPKRALSKANARQLVLTYDAALIRRALNVVVKRPRVENPAGFLLTILRCETGIAFKPRKSRRHAKPRAVSDQTPALPEAPPVHTDAPPIMDSFEAMVYRTTTAVIEAAHERARASAAEWDRRMAESPHADFFKKPPPDWVPEWPPNFDADEAED